MQQIIINPTIMGKKCLLTIFGILFLGLLHSPLKAQGADEVLRYGLQYPSYDPVTMIMPGVSDAAGFGSYQENPASAALFEESFLSFGLSDRYVNEDGTYLGNTRSLDDNRASVSDIGFVYNVPTARGRLTIGGGYSQSHDYNRAIAGKARNNLSTITDSYARLSIDNPLNTAAFNAYAIDDFQNASGQTESRSVFRFPVGGGYPGIDQNFELTERGTLGEYSAFIATELLKNFIIGASIGVINGSYKYERDFLETDSQGDYNGNFVDTDDDGQGDTDIDNILSEDIIENEFSGLSARLGLVYQVAPNINIGASYQFKNVLHVDESFDTYITTAMDNTIVYSDEDFGSIDYKIVRPARFNVGITAKDLSGLTISASAERIDYSEGRIRFNDIEFADQENFENDIVRSNLEEVYNFRLGLEYKISDEFIPRVGYGYYPSPTGDFENEDLNGDRQFYSAGFTAQVSENVKLNLGAQLGRWDDRNTLYLFDDNNETFGEVVNEEVNHWNIMGGLTVGF